MMRIYRNMDVYAFQSNRYSLVTFNLIVVKTFMG